MGDCISEENVYVGLTTTTLSRWLTMYLNDSSTIGLHLRECPCVMVKAMDCRIVVNKFKHQSCYYVHFWTNTLGKGINPLLSP